ETTTNLIGNAISAMLQHPQALQRAQDDPGYLGPIIEETLRWDSPVQYLFRRATEAVTVAGTTIPKDSIVTILIGSANRDEAEWGEDAARFNPDRKLGAHIAFGFGTHYCLGASLARMEAGEALRAIVPMLSEAKRTAEPPEYVDSFQFH